MSFRRIALAAVMTWTLPAKAGVDQVYHYACAGLSAQVEAELVLGTPIENRAVECAARAGFVPVIQSFLRHGLNVNAPIDALGSTMLHLAAHRRDLATSRFLLEHGADVNLNSKLGTALIRALNPPNPPYLYLDLLFEFGASTAIAMPASNPAPLTALGMAVKNVYATPDVVDYLIRKGADVNQLAPVTGRTALFETRSDSSAPQLVKIDLLAKAGARFDIRDAEGRYAFTGTQLSRETFERYAKNGADLKLVDALGENAIFSAPCDSTVHYLGSLGVDFKLVRANGQNILHTLVANCDWKEPESEVAFRYAVSLGPDLSQRNLVTGLTPLMLAYHSGAASAGAVLLEVGADVSPRDDQGRTALHHLARNLVPVALTEVDRFVSAGAVIDAVDSLGNTSLMAAVESNRSYGIYKTAMIEALIFRGADLKLKNRDGRTACDLTWDPLESTCRHASLSIL